MPQTVPQQTHTLSPLEGLHGELHSGHPTAARADCRLQDRMAISKAGPFDEPPIELNRYMSKDCPHLAGKQWQWTRIQTMKILHPKEY